MRLPWTPGHLFSLPLGFPFPLVLKLFICPALHAWEAGSSDAGVAFGVDGRGCSVSPEEQGAWQVAQRRLQASPGKEIPEQPFLVGPGRGQSPNSLASTDWQEGVILGAWDACDPVLLIRPTELLLSC